MTARQRLGVALERAARVMEHGTLTSLTAACRRWDLLDALKRRRKVASWRIASGPSDAAQGYDAQ